MRHTVNSYSIAQFQIVSDITDNIYLVYRLDLSIHGSKLPLHGPIRDLEWRVTGTNPILDPIVFSKFLERQRKVYGDSPNCQNQAPT